MKRPDMIGNKLAVRHGLSRSKEFIVRRGMISRCYQPNSGSYKNYGAKGITVCDEWRNDPYQFYIDVGPAPGPNYTLDRIDNTVGYRPGNVRWVTWSEQNKNRRSFDRSNQIKSMMITRKSNPKKWIHRNNTRRQIPVNDPIPRGWILGYGPRPERRRKI